MLPLISSFTAASSGPHGSLSNATPDMIWPDVQYRTGNRRRRRPTDAVRRVPRPSMVVISPSCTKARLRHEFTRLPFTARAGAALPGHSPSSFQLEQLSLGCTRSVVRIDAGWRSLPLMRSVIGTAPSMFGPSAISAAGAISMGLPLRWAVPDAPITTAAATSRATKKCRGRT